MAKIPDPIAFELSPELKKLLKKGFEDARAYIGAIADATRKELIAQKGALNLFHNRLLILERQSATFATGHAEHVCACSHPRGAHADQNADGPCQAHIVVGDMNDPSGERKYAPCICEKFTAASLIIAPNRG